MINIAEELKIISLVLEFIPINAELKKNLNLTAIAIALKLRLNNIAHDIVANDEKHGIDGSLYSKVMDKIKNEETSYG